MDLNDIRKDIDALDLQMRDLLMQRLDCSHKVAEAKQASGSTDVYRADREQAMLDALGADVPDDRLPEYLAVVKKITETSRMYQYNRLYDANPGLFGYIPGAELADRPSVTVTVRFTRPDRPNSLSAILAMVGDYGFDLQALELVELDESACSATFDLTIRADTSDDRTRRLLFQLSKESSDFCILGIA